MQRAAGGNQCCARLFVGVLMNVPVACIGACAVTVGKHWCCWHAFGPEYSCTGRPAEEERWYSFVGGHHTVWRVFLMPAGV
jgi:hypothetical protein